MRRVILFFGIMLLCTLSASAQQDSTKRKMPSDKQLLSMARQYKYGIIREANPQKAAKIYSYLAHKNNPKALVELGKCYINGDGVKKDVALAQRLFEKAAKLGSKSALCHLALIYQKGLNGVVNYKRAYTLYKKAADLGSVQGMYGAGHLLYKGLGVEQNYEEAVKLLKQGAERGHSGCCLLLASYYANGYDNGQDMDKAQKYWRKASRNGNSWTIDVTKNGLTDSINKRISRRGTWQHVRNRVLKDENMPKIENTVEASKIEGTWKGKAYIYDWSRKNIVKEQDIKIKIKSIDDGMHVEYYIGDSLATAYSSVLRNNKYVSKKLSEEQRKYSWTVTQTLFETKGKFLFADLKVMNLKNVSAGKPLLAVLSKDNSTTEEQEATFSITSVKYNSGTLTIDIDASEPMNVDITATNVSGIVKLPSCSKELHSGHNILTIPTLFKKNDVAGVVNISRKNERHSKTITVVRYE